MHVGQALAGLIQEPLGLSGVLVELIDHILDGSGRDVRRSLKPDLTLRRTAQNQLNLVVQHGQSQEVEARKLTNQFARHQAARTLSESVGEFPGEAPARERLILKLDGELIVTSVHPVGEILPQGSDSTFQAGRRAK